MRSIILGVSMFMYLVKSGVLRSHVLWSDVVIDSLANYRSMDWKGLWHQISVILSSSIVKSLIVWRHLVGCWWSVCKCLQEVGHRNLFFQKQICLCMESTSHILPSFPLNSTWCSKLILSFQIISNIHYIQCTLQENISFFLADKSTEMSKKVATYH